MISVLGQWISAVFRRTVPDPFVIAVFLTFFTALLALAIGFPAPDGGERMPLAERAGALLAVWGVGGGLWELLGFSMQMCLILVTGHALAASRPVRAGLSWLAGLPRSGGQAAAMVALTACVAALVNWGLGLIVGALLAREVGRSMAGRGIGVDYPLLAAAGYTGLMIWHGGLSGSSPLAMTTVGNALKTIPRGVIERLEPAVATADPAAVNGMPLIGLERTIGSPMNLLITGGMLVIVPALFYLLSPKRVEGAALPPAAAPVEEEPRGEERDGERGGVAPEWLDRSPLVPWTLAAVMIAALVLFLRRKGAGSLGLNEINMAMLALGLVMHGSARSYLAAAEEGARGCAGIIVQFPLYAGIMAMMAGSGLVGILADAMTSMGNERTIPVLGFLAACIVNIFVPSGGGQWAVQGPIALEAGLGAGIDPAKMVMSVAYGDQLTNMLQPFWALPLLAITGVKARDIVGYTAVAMVVAGAWICAGLLMF